MTGSHGTVVVPWVRNVAIGRAHGTKSVPWPPGASCSAGVRTRVSPRTRGWGHLQGPRRGLFKPPRRSARHPSSSEEGISVTANLAQTSGAEVSGSCLEPRYPVPGRRPSLRSRSFVARTADLKFGGPRYHRRRSRTLRPAGAERAQFCGFVGIKQAGSESLGCARSAPPYTGIPGGFPGIVNKEKWGQGMDCTPKLRQRKW
jgi:hypothetical protein